MHKLPENWRIMVDGFGHYKIQRKGWFFWRDVKKYIHTSVGGMGITRYFKSKEEACEAARAIIKTEFMAYQGWKDAGKC